MDQLKDYIPLLSTLIGGLLAISGGVVSSLLIQRYVNERENKKIQADKAEELYKMILKLDHLAHCMNNMALYDNLKGEPPEEVKLSQYEYNQIDMIIGLYFSQLSEAAKNYTSKRNKHLVSFMRFMLKHSKENILPGEEELGSFKAEGEEYNVASEALRVGLVKVINS